MGAGTAVVAYDVVFNREVLEDDAQFFAGPDKVSAALLRPRRRPTRRWRRGAAAAAAERALQLGRHASDYEKLAEGLLTGRCRVAGARSPRLEPASAAHRRCGTRTREKLAHSSGVRTTDVPPAEGGRDREPRGGRPRPADRDAVVPSGHASGCGEAGRGLRRGGLLVAGNRNGVPSEPAGARRRLGHQDLGDRGGDDEADRRQHKGQEDPGDDDATGVGRRRRLERPGADDHGGPGRPGRPRPRRAGRQRSEDRELRRPGGRPARDPRAAGA